MGLNSILYKRYKHLLPKEEIEEMEQRVWWSFLEAIYTRCNCYLGDKRQSSIIEIKNKFNDFLVIRGAAKNKKDCFLEGLGYFLRHIPTYNLVNDSEYGYVWVDNIGFDQKDIGVVLFNRTILSSEILFFQIIDKD